MVQLMPLTVSCFSKIHIVIIFLVPPAHLGSPGRRDIKRVLLLLRVLVEYYTYIMASYVTLQPDILHCVTSYGSLHYVTQGWKTHVSQNNLWYYKYIYWWEF